MKVEQSTLPCKGCLPQEGVQACGRLVLHNNKEALSSLHQDGSDKLYTELQEATIERKKVSKSNPIKRRYHFGISVKTNNTFFFQVPKYGRKGQQMAKNSPFFVPLKKILKKSFFSLS